MKRVADVALAVIVVLCVIAMMQWASIGPLTHTHMIFLLPALAFGGLAFVGAWLAIGLAHLRASPDDRRRSRSRIIAAGVAVLVTAGLVMTGVSNWVAFAVSRGALDDLVATLPADGPVQPTPIHRWAGLFEVDEYAVDADGGVYLRVGSSSLIETTSYGFCIKPHATTSPFGGAYYRHWEIGGRWHEFTANDDWY